MTDASPAPAAARPSLPTAAVAVERSAEAVARGLADARLRSEVLTDIDTTELTRQHDPLMSPLVWDLAHIGQQEDLWLLRGGDPGAQGVLPCAVEKLYDAFEHPRAERATLPLLSPQEARGFLADVRARVLDGLAAADRAAADSAADSADDPLFPFVMVEQHEQMHVETMLATHQLRDGAPLLGTGSALPPGRAGAHGSVLVPAGEFVLGVDGTDEPWSLDNERPAHVVHLPAFRIGRVPVTNGEYRRFVQAGGYAQQQWWSAPGWAHRTAAGLERPQFWSADNAARRRFGVVEQLPADEPVQHVCFFEAEAYARWAGARLPTEQEWEKACAWDPAAGRRRRWPWGDSPWTPALANLGGAALRPAAAGAYPGGASAYGVEQLIGDVWEWTSSAFEPWPGFTPMLYRQYSAPFFGRPDEFRVLRGGSWAVGGNAIRPSLRNWDLPIRRQIFTGFRLAWDADSDADV